MTIFYKALLNKVGGKGATSDISYYYYSFYFHSSIVFLLMFTLSRPAETFTIVLTYPYVILCVAVESPLVNEGS